jgi:hypothetical protein
VYVVPEDDAYIYVVHTDGTTPTLLNAPDAPTRGSKGSPVMFPAPEKFYKIDGASDKEAITVICSPAELREVTQLFQTTRVTQKSWTSLEKDLMEKSKIDLTPKAEKPFLMAGVVRSIGNDPVHSAPADPFVNTLPIFSGKTFIVKKYDFQVQK